MQKYHQVALACSVWVFAQKMNLRCSILPFFQLCSVLFLYNTSSRLYAVSVLVSGICVGVNVCSSVGISVGSSVVSPSLSVLVSVLMLVSVSMSEEVVLVLVVSGGVREEWSMRLRL